MGDTLDPNVSPPGTSETPGAETPQPDSYTDKFSNAIQAANLDATQQGYKSFSDTSVDFLQKGVPLTGAAIVNSFINTGVEVGNFFGADMQKVSIEDEFAPDSDTVDYYQRHAGLIEGAAYAIGSLAPGLGAIKLLKLAQAGEIGGSALQAITGLASGIQDTAIKAATEDLVGNGVGTSLFGISAVNKTKAILAGVADQALQGAVYQTAALATMHASPITDDNTLMDDVSDVISSAKGFATFGGLIEGAQTFYKINKAVKIADMSTKAQEAFGSAGMANLTPGDRIVNLYDTLDNIPAPTNRLGEMKYNFTRDKTQREIRDQFIQAAGGDKDLAARAHGFIENLRSSGMATSDDIVNNFGQLSKLGRITDADVASTPSDVFYFPGKIDPADVSSITHEQLVSRIATGDYAASKAFILKSPTAVPDIARATDKISLAPLEGGQIATGVPKYDGATDAWKKGADVFLDSNGKVHINPQSGVLEETTRPGEARKVTAAERTEMIKTGNLPADSAPLNSAPMILDTATGKYYGENVLPVLGDFGKPELRPNGVRVGDTLFEHKPGEALDLNDPMDAHSRYIWASLRGIKKGDAIASDDLPMLEQAYREMAAGNNSIEGNGLSTFTNGTSIPKNAPDMLSYIAGVKQDKYIDLLQNGKNADEIGHILNTPTAGMTKNFNTLDPAELMMDPAMNSQIRHIRMSYDIGTTKDAEGNLLRGMIATNYRGKLAMDAASDQVANYLGKMFSPQDPSGKLATQYFQALQYTKGAQDADIAGAGQSFFANANADYGTFQEQTQRIGRFVSEILTKRQGAISDTLSGAANDVRNDPAASAEYGNFVAVRHTTAENYIMLNDNDAAALGLPKNTAVLEGGFSKDPKTGQPSFNKNYLPEGFVRGDYSGPGPAFGRVQLKNYYTLSPKVAALEVASRDINAFRNDLRSGWQKAQGLSKSPINPDILHAPAIDTTNYKYFAYVRHREGYALGESGASVVTAKTAEDLQTKLSNLGPEFDSFSKAQIADYKKAQGEFEFNRNFASGKVSSELARKGILNDVVPESRGQNLIDNLANWHYRQEAQLLRDHVELHNAATFAQLRAMGDRFDQTGTSVFGAVTPFTERSAKNPYMSYIRTALGISNKDNYPLWTLAQEKVDGLASYAFNQAKAAFGAVQKGILPYEDAIKVSEKLGLGNPYGTAINELAKQGYYGGLANQLPEQKLLSKFVAASGSILGATVIKLDTFQQLIHAVTLPIMVALEHGSATRDLQNLLMTKTPGANSIQVPGFSRTLYNMVRNYFGPQSEQLQQLYNSATGLPRDLLQYHRQMVDELTLPYGKLSSSGWAQKIDNASQLGEKISGTRFTNNFIHFGASNIGHQIGEASGLQGRDLLDFIGSFTSRVQGNFAAGQRAGIFSGPIGQAMGLFQSYQWNMMQQLLRHIGEGDVKALAMGAGMQSAIFGVSSLPGFQALNQLIQQRHGNTSGADLYSATNEALGPDVADYLLYGGLSGLTGLSLYSRGDLNPRRASILPLNPLNFPSVSAGIKTYQMLAQLQSNVAKGGSVPASLLLAAEHNSLSRPLAGLAEMVQGFSTNTSGQLISSTSGLSDLNGIANMSRILGARPLEESIAMDNLYRSNAMQALDNARLQSLGEAAKTALYGGNYFAPELATNFMSEYVKAGGRQENFSGWWMRQQQDANTSAANRVFNAFKSPRARSLQVTMGGQMLPDFKTVPIEATQNPNEGLVQP